MTEKLRNDKKAAVILAAGMLGMLLLLLSCVLPSTESKTKNEGENRLAEIEKLTEEKLTALLSSVKDVGRVRVAVSYECLEEYEYAKDEKRQGDEKTENEFVITDNGSSDSGLILRVTAPKVRGVAVCCEGAASAQVREEVTRLICSALGIGANKVYVAQMKE